MPTDPDPGKPQELVPPSDTIARAPILIYKTLISFLKAACSSRVANRREIVRIQGILNGHVLAMTSDDVVGVVVKSLQWRRTLLELAAELGLTNEPNLRHSMRADEAELVTHVMSILDSKATEKIVLSLEGDAAQFFIDVVQDILDRGFLMEREQMKKARRIIRKLSEVCDKLPSALFVTGVSGCPEHPKFGGGFGDVYCASHNGKAVALKVMRHFSQGAKLRDIHLKICREALVWRDLHHPHILPLIGIDRDTFPFLAMVSPWMEHGTVLRHLDCHGRADVDKLLFQIAQGIEYLHSRKIVHGDLRGANILVNDDWMACLADFGLSVFTDPVSTLSSQERAGSLYWMAPELINPEQFGCKFAQTPATDVYAFGCICVELYTGRPPLSELPIVSAMLHILNGERAQHPTGSPAISDTLWQNITKYWAADPAARPSSQIVAQQMVWPAFEEGEDPLVDEEAATPVMEINPRESSKVEHIDTSGNLGDDVNHVMPMKDGDSEAVTSEAWSNPELKKTALIKEQDSEELRIDSSEGIQDNPNKVGLVEEEELTLKSIIPLLKNAKISDNPNQLPQDSISPQQSQLQLEDNGPRREANNGPAASMQAQEATAGLMKAIQDGSLTQILMSFVEKGANVNIKADLGHHGWWTALQLGSSWGDKEFVAVLLAHGADPNIRGPYGTALNAASRYGHVEIVKLLLESGANMNIQGPFGDTALISASTYGHVEIVKLLLEYGADVNIQDEDGAALHHASKYDCLEVAKVLIEHGADVNNYASGCGTALHVASERGKLEVVKLLIKHGADPNMKYYYYGTAMEYALNAGKWDVVAFLRNHAKISDNPNQFSQDSISPQQSQLQLEDNGPRREANNGPTASTQAKEDATAGLMKAIQNHSLTRILMSFVEKGADVNIKADVGSYQWSTALQLGSSRGDKELIAVLLAHGADPNIQALNTACIRGHVEIVKLLLESGAGVNIQGGPHAALITASVYGHVEIVKFLLESGADVNIQGDHFHKALTAACGSGGKLEIVKLLLKAGADVNIQNDANKTALTAASASGGLEMVKLLLESGADVNIKDGYGSALHYASNYGYLEVAKVLIEHRADVDNYASSCGTALHVASQRGKLEVVKLLIEHGADPNIKDDLYRTAMEIAQNAGQRDVVDFLGKHGRRW